MIIKLKTGGRKLGSKAKDLLVSCISLYLLRILFLSSCRPTVLGRNEHVLPILHGKDSKFSSS